jgi:two-component system, OmpR family, KDP operon response regulator KdpE
MIDALIFIRTLFVRPSLIIFDPAMPDMNGAELLQTVRSWSNVPVIILSPRQFSSSRSEEERKVQFLRAGADDYMTKPFGIAGLAARCEAALPRYHKGADLDPVVQTGPLMINLVTREVTLTASTLRWRARNIGCCTCWTRTSGW